MIKFKNTYQQFLKYLKNQFPNTGRHDFEKSVQKNSFEQDALDGLETLTATECEADMLFLNKKIETKIKANTKSPLLYKLGIAASVLLLLGGGILLLNKEKTTDFVYDVDSKELPSVKRENEKNTVKPEFVYQEAEDFINEKKSPPKHKTSIIDNSTINITEEIVLEKAQIQEPPITGYKQKKTDTEVTLKSNDSSSVYTLIEGVVSGEEFPLAGITIKIKTGNTTVISNFEGKYSIQAKKGDTLEFSGLGFKTMEALANNDLNISLIKDTNTLDTITIPAYNPISSSENLIKETNTVNRKQERKYLRKIRKTKKSKVRIFRLERGIGIKKQKKEEKLSTQPNISKNNTPNTLEDFGNWIDLNLNSTLFEPNKLYYVKVSFEITDSKRINNVRFRSINDNKIQHELKRVLLSAPNWILDVFNDKEALELIDIELQIIF